ncbi:MAG: beta-hydroxyacyl-ACP dehydratase [Paraprevotella sp.]|nr:beta-hydroxyacyl-ACP dehydratase [Paraprevotella sp.]
MNKFFHIIRKERGEESWTVWIRLNPDHEIYKAHFPSAPITPGVCQIQMITEVLSLHLGCEVFLTEIKNVKYIAVISPEEHTEWAIKLMKIVENGEECKISASFAIGEQVFSKMSMTYHVVRDHSDI